jgi:hypothetical protein
MPWSFYQWIMDWSIHVVIGLMGIFAMLAYTMKREGDG